MTSDFNVKVERGSYPVFLIIYVLIQSFLLAGWLIPGWFLNDAPWGLIFLPTWIFLAILFLILGFIFLIVVVGFAAFVKSESRE